MITLYCIHPKGFNIGNDAIHFALRELVHQAFGRVVNLISLPATSVYENHAKAGLTPKTVHEMNRLADGVIVGGGNLYENGELAVVPDALEALQPPMMLFSLSRGRVYSRNLRLVERTDAMPARTIAALHERADYSLARDSATLDYLHANGGERAVLGACPTIGLYRTANQLPALPSAEVAGVLISIRTPGLMNLPRRLQSRVLSDIERTIDLVRARGAKRVRILCNDVRDVEFASTFQATRNVDFVYTSDVRWYLSLLKNAELVVSYRLHATLPSISFGTPVVSISYDERAMSLLKDLGLESWDINVAAETDLVAAIERRLDDLPRLASLREENRARWDGVWENQLEQMTAFAGDVKKYIKSVQSEATAPDER